MSCKLTRRRKTITGIRNPRHPHHQVRQRHKLSKRGDRAEFELHQEAPHGGGTLEVSLFHKNRNGEPGSRFSAKESINLLNKSNCDSFPIQRQLTCRSWPLRPRLRRSPRWTTRPRPQTRPPRSGGGSWRPSGTCSHWTPPPRMAAETPRPCPSRRPCTPPGKNVTFEGPRPNVQLGSPM